MPGHIIFCLCAAFMFLIYKGWVVCVVGMIWERVIYCGRDSLPNGLSPQWNSGHEVNSI